MRIFRVVSGFTLAELLIALGILGVIATFTIPKVLMAQQDSAYCANAKDVAAAMSGAYQALQMNGQLTTSTTLGDLKPYLNYIQVFTGTVDDSYTDGTFTCGGASYECLKLHNGGVVAYRANAAFGGSASTNALPFFFDPDGKTDGTTNGPAKSVPIFIYYNGRVVDRSGVLAGTSNTITSYGANASKIPPWFSWD